MQSASRSQLLCIMFPSHARFLLLAYSSLLHSSQGSLSDRSSDDHLAVAEQAQCFPGEGTHMGTTSKDHADGDGDQDPSDVSLLHLSSEVTFRTMKSSAPERVQVSTSKTEHDPEQLPILVTPAVSASQRHAAQWRQTKVNASEDTQSFKEFGDLSGSSGRSAALQVSSDPDAQPTSLATSSGTSRRPQGSPVSTLQTRSGTSTALQRIAMPSPEHAPSEMKTKHNKSAVLGTVQRQHEEASHTMLLSEAREARVRGSLDTILTVVLIVALVLFALLLYRNNLDFQQTVHEITESPTQAFEGAKEEAKDLYHAQFPEEKKKMACCGPKG
mmetsp:Transcript_135611/g.343186  ORF Transcript_135611/g.343186 Transcript_135611/m.343186 type:complete len:329 (+) Transcript_135611:79-1065(+)